MPVPHSIESNIRLCGVPTKLVRGKVVLDDPHEICHEGQTLNSHQTALLKMFGITMAEFKIKITAFYDSTTHQVTPVEPAL